ncbi:MAG TPA: VOC family protein [Polyangia bacterium]|nr:VOC family protein [Polyangia bacterium]
MANAFAHIELNTDDLAKAQKFYKSLFDWKLRPFGPDYTMIDVGKGGTGGGMQKKAMAEAPTAWLPYVQVDDVKKTIAKARRLGATIQAEYVDIGEMGAIGVFTDPTGASIGVWALTAKPKAARAKKKPAKKRAK